MSSEKEIKSTPEEILGESSPKKERPKLTEQQKIENMRAISLIAGSLREVSEISEQSIDFVVRVFERFGFVIDLDKSRHPEVIAIVFSVAKEWSEGEMSNKKMFLLLDELLSRENIFISETRKHDKLRGTGYMLTFFMTVPGLVNDVLIPELQHLDIELNERDPVDIFIGLEEREIFSISEKVYDYLENLAVDGVYKVPFNGKHTDIVIAVAEKLGADITAGYFEALAVRKGLIITGENPSKMTIAHEKNHVNNPGLAIGRFGYSINEAITEYLARVEVNPGINPASLRYVFTGGYPSEISLINKLRKINPKVVELMIASYRDDSREVSVDLIQELVGTIGLDGYLKLYMASPYITGKDVSQTKAIQLKTSEVHKHIKRLQKVA